MPLSRILYNSLRGPPSPSGLTDATVRILGLPTACNELLLYQLFSPFGAVLGVSIHRDPAVSWVTAEVQFARHSDAVQVREVLQVATLWGQRLHATLVNVPPSPGPC
jgi:RNA recognition motif-containing protein